MMADFDLPAARDWRAPAFEAFAQAQLFHRDVSLIDVAQHCRGSLSYLATPYSKVALDAWGDWCPSTSLECAEQAGLCARSLALAGVTAISPIIQAVEMVHADFRDERLDPLDAEFWEAWCRPLLAASWYVIVPPIDGWAESDGIWLEVRTALQFGRSGFLNREGEDCGAEI